MLSAIQMQRFKRGLVVSSSSLDCDCGDRYSEELDYDVALNLLRLLCSHLTALL